MNFSNLTTLQIGGPIKQLIPVKTEDELIAALKLPTTNYQLPLVIGSGSNLLVSDEGFDGTVVKNEITGIEQNSNTLKVKSGTILQDLIDFANSKGLSGLQNLAGIPGTVGGAIYGNAGAYGQTISDHIKNVLYLPPTTSFRGSTPKIILLAKADCHFSYRDSLFKKTKDIILEVEFKLSPANPQHLKRESAETIKKREIKYPPGIKCPGSFFKNIIASELPKQILEKIPPEKIVYGKLPSGSLLEMVGAKGDQLGQIKIAEYHANLFINLGSGTAQDFHTLAKKYFEKIKEKFEIELEPEVQLINLPKL